MSKDANSKFGLSQECKVVLTLKNLICEICHIDRLKEKTIWPFKNKQDKYLIKFNIYLWLKSKQNPLEN